MTSGTTSSRLNRNTFLFIVLQIYAWLIAAQYAVGLHYDAPGDAADKVIGAAVTYFVWFASAVGASILLWRGRGHVLAALCVVLPLMCVGLAISAIIRKGGNLEKPPRPLLAIDLGMIGAMILAVLGLLHHAYRAIRNERNLAHS